MPMDPEDVAALRVYGLFALAGAGVVVAGGWLHYKRPLPPLRDDEKAKVEKPPDTRGETLAGARTLAGYRALVAEDARKFGVGVQESALAEPFPYQIEFQGAQRLSDRDTLATAHLQIGARVEREWRQMAAKGGIGVDQFLLTIQNRTSRYLAYRVVTDVPDPRACRSMGAVSQNAIALRPSEQVVRAECVWSRGFSVLLRKVEVMEIPSVSYYYLSRLHPPHVLYEERTSEGHRPPVGKACELVPWRDIQAGADAGEVSWADVIDFYARHNCDEYTFFRGYERRKKRSDPLPALGPLSGGPSK